MKYALGFSVFLNVLMFLVLVVGATYSYMAFRSMEQQIVNARDMASFQIENLKTAFESGKEQILNEYKEIKENTVFKNAEEIHSNIKFANDLLDLIQSSGGIIVNENIAWKDKEVSAEEWAGRARAEAKLLAFSYDGQEIISRLSSTKFGDDWKIYFDDQSPIRLYDWLSQSDIVQHRMLNKTMHTTAESGA